MAIDRNSPGKNGAWIGNPRDFYGAAILLLLALFVLWATRDLPGQRGFQLGAGSVPRLFAAVLAANAALVMAMSIVGRGPAIQYSLPAAIAIAVLGAIGVVIHVFAGPVISVTIMIVVAFAFLRKLSLLEIRGPVFIALGVLAFAVFVKPLGLLIAAFALVVVSSAASKEFKPGESLLWAAILSVFSCALFVILLNLPIRILPFFLMSQ